MTLALSAAQDILNPGFALAALLVYVALVMCNQALLVRAIHSCGAEDLPRLQRLKLIGVAVTEFFFFHPLNLFIKGLAFVTYRRHKQTWNHLDRAKAD